MRVQHAPETCTLLHSLPPRSPAVAVMTTSGDNPHLCRNNVQRCHPSRHGARQFVEAQKSL